MEGTFAHFVIALGGATGFGIVAHAVQSFPTPSNKYAAWFLGVIQFAVGQRQRAINTMDGYKTVTYQGNKPQ